MLIGSLILIAGLILNDKFCYKTGIPYVVQLKSAFGTKGTVVPAMIRAAPAVVWYGVQKAGWRVPPLTRYPKPFSAMTI
jgi:NCS1 family nucleobase:cation symporter-1